MIENLLASRGIPALMTHTDGSPVTAESWERRRAELRALLALEYGREIPAPDAVRAEGSVDDDHTLAMGGHVVCERVRLSFSVAGAEYSFPVRLFRPTRRLSVPYIVLLNFRPDAYDCYSPTEEIIDRGFGLVQVCYNDIGRDENVFDRGLDGLCGDRSLPDAPGKLRLWAYAASRVADWLLTRPETDPKRLAVVGHSRLGKTALLCGAYDERFRYICSNDSGCCGAAITRGKVGESLRFINDTFPHWFCPGYRAYADRPEILPFDQHFLLALCAPRFVLVNSAELDTWADPVSEYLCCCAADEAWKLLGKRGFLHSDRLPATGERYLAGDLGYSLRPGAHFFCREDWGTFMSFMETHR